jgi:uncharacterized Zn finger protein
MAQQHTTAQVWRDLTWDDLELWAGSTSVARGQEYFRGGHVQQLAITPDGQLLAWVQGTSRYATTVEGKTPAKGLDSPLRSRCSCPVGFSCKHAVALVLAYLDTMQKGKPVALAQEDDPRWGLLPQDNMPFPTAPHPLDHDWVEMDPDGSAEMMTAEYDEEDFLAEEEESGEADTVEMQAAPTRKTRDKKDMTAKAAPKDVQKHLEAKSPTWLVNYLLELCGRFPEIREELQEQIALGSDDMTQLIRETRKEIRRRTGESAYVHHWSGDGHLPDYSGIKKRFAKLLAGKQYEALMELGQELFEQGCGQVESSDDEGETAMAIAECLSLVFKAVPKAQQPPERKLLYVIDICLADDFSLCEGAHDVLEAKWPKAAWSAVADTLWERLRQLPMPRGQEFSDRYERDSLSGWLIRALERAGRGDEVLPLCEEEARVTGCYERLVNRLLQAGQMAAAEKWAREGILKTKSQYPGIAQNLQRTLRDLAEQREDWPTVAAHCAEEFFQIPSVHTYEQLLAAAEKAGCGPAVKTALRRFLETGNKPGAQDWPLPWLTKPEAPPSAPSSGKGKKTKGSQPPPPPAPKAQPRYDVLLELAFKADNKEEILQWYDKLYQGRNILPYSWGYGQAGDNAIRVADAVAATHPERSIALYRERIEALVDVTQPAAYQTAGQLLRKLRKVLSTQNRAAEWDTFVSELRTKHQRKRKFLEVLDRLKNPKIIGE